MEAITILNKSIECVKIYRTLHSSKNVQICGIDKDRVQVYQGLETLAKSVGKHIHVREIENEIYPFEMFFIYKEVTFFELCSEKPEGLNGTN